MIVFVGTLLRAWTSEASAGDNCRPRSHSSRGTSLPGNLKGSEEGALKKRDQTVPLCLDAAKKKLKSLTNSADKGEPQNEITHCFDFDDIERYLRFRRK